MQIRKATINDLEEIYSVYKKVTLDRTKLQSPNYQASIQTNGFLLGGDDKEDYKNHINNACVFLVAEEDGKIIGYQVAEHKKEFQDDKYKTWFDLDAKDTYYNSDLSMTSAHLATAPMHARQGVASGLEREMEDVLKNLGFQFFFSIITISPLTNCPSLIFHSKQNFRRVAIGKPKNLFGVNDYASVLFLKQIS